MDRRTGKEIMTGNAGVGRDGQWPEKAARYSGERPFALRYRAIGGRTQVIVRGHLGEADAQRAYEYFDGVIQDDRQLLTVRMSGASSCDGYGVRALARAACRAAGVGQPLLLSGPALVLLQIVKTGQAGHVFLKWPNGSRLEWADPQAVAARLAHLGLPQQQTWPC